MLSSTWSLVVATCLWAIVGQAQAGTRGEALRAALAGADRVVVDKGSSPDGSQSFEEFHFIGQARIAELVAQLEFDDAESGFHCMCSGDADVTFLQGGRPLARISHHHGRSLRWNGGPWEGDALFTSAAAKAWPAWFKAQGDSRFEVMLAQDRAESEKREARAARILAAFPPEARAIFAENLKVQNGLLGREKEAEAMDGFCRRLVALFPNRPSAAVATAQALGSHSLAGGWEASWSGATSDEGLLLHFARQWTAAEFGLVLQHSGLATQLGAARLFFFESLAKLFPAVERGARAARLAEVVLREDRWRPTRS